MNTTIVPSSENKNFPVIIQGGMGINVSDPLLARTVSGASRPGRETLGTISGTTVDRVMARMLQQGGPGADSIINALSDFPFGGVSERVIKAYHNKPLARIPTFTVDPPKSLLELTICANYAFVKLAKQGHDNPVSVNYLEKIGMPHLPSIYGAMLAGGDYITMGAGIPTGIPAIFQAFSEGREGKYTIPVIGSKEGYMLQFNPKDFFGGKIPEVKVPKFLPIISTDTLAKVLNKRIHGLITGFIIETPLAGGHNAPPRGGEKEYGERDEVNFSVMKDIGLPYWLGGAYASPEGLKKAQELGAVGIQAGSIFALSEESGMRPDLRTKILEMAYNGTLKITTDRNASPTGFPFKVVEILGTLSEELTYENRNRLCDEGALRSLYQKSDGTIGYRCPGEPVDSYIKKGGNLAETIGKKCLCNGLMATAGIKDEIPIVTLGDEVKEFVRILLKGPHGSYSALSALDYMFSSPPTHFHR